LGFAAASCCGILRIKSRCATCSACICAVAVQLGDALLLKPDMPLAIGHRFLSNGEVLSLGPWRCLPL
jgi:hypothetical protein